jgi:thiamine pyrophosphate-dependent acetolactate synthase large subunit-like protein
MKVYERMADAFQAEGTTHVFGMMGDANMYWMNALIDRGVDCIEVRHEGVGMGMADGWARHRHLQAIRCMMRASGSGYPPGEPCNDSGACLSAHDMVRRAAAAYTACG